MDSRELSENCGGYWGGYPRMDCYFSLEMRNLEKKITPCMNGPCDHLPSFHKLNAMPFLLMFRVELQVVLILCFPSLLGNG